MYNSSESAKNIAFRKHYNLYFIRKTKKDLWTTTCLKNREKKTRLFVWPFLKLQNRKVWDSYVRPNHYCPISFPGFSSPSSDDGFNLIDDYFYGNQFLFLSCFLSFVISLSNKANSYFSDGRFLIDNAKPFAVVICCYFIVKVQICEVMKQRPDLSNWTKPAGSTIVSIFKPSSK